MELHEMRKDVEFAIIKYSSLEQDKVHFQLKRYF